MNALAQQEPISEKEKKAVIDSTVKVLLNYYVLPAKAKEMADYLLLQHKQKAYKGFVNYTDFLKQLNKDLQTKHQDLHLKLSYNPERVALIRKATGAKPDSTLFTKRAAQHRYFNYGIAKVNRLEGNVTYIDLRQFVTVSDEAKKTIEAALTLNPDPNAFIIDLRENGGGAIAMGSYISSFFFKDSVHLSDVINKITNKIDYYWTHPSQTTKKYVNTPIYLLVSGNTFSAAEEFAYSLKNQKRATLIGETTAGGAHGYGSKDISNSIVIGIPYERIVNAVTNDNWEGKGVKPDIVVSALKSLEHAHLLAIENMQNVIDDEDAKAEINWKKAYLQAIVKPIKISTDTINRYTGTYGSRKIFTVGDDLYLQRSDKMVFRLLPINENTFHINELNYRLQFIPGNDEKMKLYIVFEDGYKQEIK
jgi:hypothetical protein